MSADLQIAFLSGVQDGFHAVGNAPDALKSCTDHAWSVCGQIVRVAWSAEQFPVPYSPGEAPQSLDPCPACMWEVAARTDTLEAVLATLGDPLAHDVATAILNEAHRDLALDDPAVLQLLTAVTRHSPALLVAEDCAEGDCDHPSGEHPGQREACRACSLQDGSWAGEWDGQYRPECTIPSPCAPLLALAASFGVAVPGSTP